jgi:hypothetical protein
VCVQDESMSNRRQWLLCHDGDGSC